MFDHDPVTLHPEIKYCERAANWLRVKASLFKILHAVSIGVVVGLPLFGVISPVVNAAGHEIIKSSSLLFIAPVVFIFALTLIHRSPKSSGPPLLVSAHKSYELSVKFDKLADGFKAAIEHKDERYRKMRIGKLKIVLAKLRAEQFADSLHFLRQISETVERFRGRR